ncbi:MAG TPA: hypothetical protein VF477_03815 [Mycobacterium sp.]
MSELTTFSAPIGIFELAGRNAVVAKDFSTRQLLAIGLFPAPV